ncbi:MAG: 50S ribosomal protein L19 [Anaerolineae bacterium]
MANAVDLIRSIENHKEEVTDLAPGDTVKVHVRIVEGNRERVQVVQGVVIRIRGGVLRHAHVRRAKLYFLRERSGKSARLRERRV